LTVDADYHRLGELFVARQIHGYRASAREKTPVSISSLNRRRSFAIFVFGSSPNHWATAAPSLPPDDSYCRRTVNQVRCPSPVGLNSTEPALSTSAPCSDLHPMR